VPPYHLYTQFFLNCHYCGKGALCFCFDLARGFLHGVTTSPLHQHFFGLSLSWEGCLILLLRFSQGISSGYHHATPTPIFFRNFHYCGKEALCFCFDLAKVFLQGANMPPQTHKKIGFFIIAGRGIMLLLLLRLSQGISSGCHHATLSTKKFDLPLLG